MLGVLLSPPAAEVTHSGWPGTSGSESPWCAESSASWCWFPVLSLPVLREVALALPLLPESRVPATWDAGSALPPVCALEDKGVSRLCPSTAQQPECPPSPQPPQALSQSPPITVSRASFSLFNWPCLWTHLTEMP